MGNLLRRRVFVDSVEVHPEDLVVGFQPKTKALGWTQSIPYTASTVFLYGHKYRIKLDATLDTGSRALLFLGGTGGGNQANFPFSQDGEIVKTLEISKNTTYSKDIYVYCRPSSNDSKTHTIIIKNLEIFDIT